MRKAISGDVYQTAILAATGTCARSRAGDCRTSRDNLIVIITSAS